MTAACLAFDTSGPHVSAALSVDGDLTSRVEPLKRGQGERLLPLCEELLYAQGLAWSDLDALGVGIGPGNFTGIRLSVSAARGLALALSIPARGISRFETTQSLSPGKSCLSVPAPREHVYLSEDSTPVRMVLAAGVRETETASSADFSEEAHIRAMVTLAGSARGQTPPVPLYVKRADAAPPKDAPPTLIDG